MHRIILVLFFILCSNIYGQNQAAIWYFGEYAGIDFRWGKPIALLDGQSDRYSCMTVCSDSARLLFYGGSGGRIFNKEHQWMTDSCLKITGAYQACIPAEVPNRPGYYYIFHYSLHYDDGERKFSLYYSVVNMHENDGLGYIPKAGMNTLILSDIAPLQSIALHSNGYDYWWLAHSKQSNLFYAYKVDMHGVGNTPVMSVAGKPFTYKTDDGGPFRVSPDNEKAAIRIDSMHKVELFDFDNSTGKISNPIQLEVPKWQFVNSIEFSPDSRILYILAHNPYVLYQADAKASDNAAFQSSLTIVDTLRRKHGDMKLGYGGKIYMATGIKPYVSEIHFPNRWGKKCHVEEYSIYLEPDWQNYRSSWSLPNHLNSIFKERCSPEAFEYPEFTSPEGLSLAGDAKIDSSADMTLLEKYSRGALWHALPVPLTNGFETEFRFRMSDGDNNKYEDNSEPGADGIAFVIQSASPGAVGEAGYGIGYHGLRNSLAVEFDTYNNDENQIDDMHDPNGSHVAVQCAGSGPNSADHTSGACLGISDTVTLRADGRDHWAKIVYDAAGKTLKIFLDTAGYYFAPALTIEDFDLGGLPDLIDGDKAYVGFTSATGNAYERHIIDYWTFCPYAREEVTGIIEEEEGETDMPVFSAFPNPFEYGTSFFVNNNQPGAIIIYGLMGNRIRTLGPNAGNNYYWDGTDNKGLPAAPGIYMAVFKAGGKCGTARILKTK